MTQFCGKAPFFYASCYWELETNLLSEFFSAQLAGQTELHDKNEAGTGWQRSVEDPIII